jgi:hypothetical protein
MYNTLLSTNLRIVSKFSALAVGISLTILRSQFSLNAALESSPSRHRDPAFANQFGNSSKPNDQEVRKMDDGHDYRYNAPRDQWEAESADHAETPPLDKSREPRHNEVRRIDGVLKRYNGALKQWLHV